MDWNQFWHSRWNEGKINFHQNNVEIFLETYFPPLSPQKIFVPLCGKSKDMLYFSNAGHEVIGIELSELACETFFNENQIPFVKFEEGDFTVFKSDRISLYCGDFFKTKAGFLAGVSWIYDRAALIALPEALRQTYVKHLLYLLKDEALKTQIFLITLSYDESLKDGPPFSVRPEEVTRLYEKHFEIRKLISDEDHTSMNTHQGMRPIDVSEHVFTMLKLQF